MSSPICGVEYSYTDGACAWCGHPKSWHGRVGKRTSVFRCGFPGCGYQFWDASFDDANAHWLTHVPAPTAAPAVPVTTRKPDPYAAARRLLLHGSEPWEMSAAGWGKVVDDAIELVVLVARQEVAAPSSEPERPSTEGEAGRG